MEKMEAGSVQLELKYCERCGGLWLRLRGSDLVYCGSCAKAMAGLWSNSKGGLLSSRGATSASAESRSRFWSEGGNA